MAQSNEQEKGEKDVTIDEARRQQPRRHNYRADSEEAADENRDRASHISHQNRPVLTALRQGFDGAIDQLILGLGAAALLLAPFPFEVALLGWLGVRETMLLAALGLVCFEAMFYSWEKLPFTCSYLPGRFRCGSEPCNCLPSWDCFQQ